jgi:hypothetical protein
VLRKGNRFLCERKKLILFAVAVNCLRIFVGFVLLDLFSFLCNVLYIFVCPIVFFLLAIVLSVLLQLMASDDSFVIFKLFVKWELRNKQYLCKDKHWQIYGSKTSGFRVPKMCPSWELYHHNCSWRMEYLLQIQSLSSWLNVLVFLIYIYSCVIGEVTLDTTIWSSFASTKYYQSTKKPSASCAERIIPKVVSKQ